MPISIVVPDDNARNSRIKYISSVMCESDALASYDAGVIWRKACAAVERKTVHIFSVARGNLL